MLTFLLFSSFFMNIVFASDTECPLVATPGADRRTDKNTNQCRGRLRPCRRDHKGIANIRPSGEYTWSNLWLFHV